MEEEAVIDTNVLIYDTLEDSAFHEKAKQLLDTIQKQIIPSVVLEEFIIFLVKMEVERNFISRKIEEILTSEKIELAPLKKKISNFLYILLIKENYLLRR